MTVIRPDEQPEIFRPGGVRTVHLVDASTGATAFTSGITYFDEPGSATPLHSHDCEESVTILAGEATFEDERETHELGPGDTTFVPAGVVHRFRNRGEGPMSILWVYGSATPMRTIAETGETYPIGAEGVR